MTDHMARILDVLDKDTWMARAAIRHVTKMDTAMCGRTLHLLADLGLVERRIVTGVGRGTHWYRLAMRNRG